MVPHSRRVRRERGRKLARAGWSNLRNKIMQHGTMHGLPRMIEAIYRAIAVAKPNDVVIIAGKGHETYQINGSDKFHFDDREVAAEALKRISEDF